jgi:hypothetical protein
MNNDIRYTMLVLEGLEINHRMDSDVLNMIRGLMVESEQLDEGVLDTIKDKAAAFAEKVKDSAKNILPSITQKFDNVLAQVRTKQGDEAADAIESEMAKKGGSNWKNNSVKIAAALAVASSLAQASPAQAREMYMHMSPFQAQQLSMQNQTNWSRHRAMRGQDWEYQQQMRGNYPRGYYQQNRGGGNDAAALAIGVMIGAALGAALSQPQN